MYPIGRHRSRGPGVWKLDWRKKMMGGWPGSPGTCSLRPPDPLKFEPLSGPWGKCALKGLMVEVGMWVQLWKQDRPGTGRSVPPGTCPCPSGSWKGKMRAGVSVAGVASPWISLANCQILVSPTSHPPWTPKPTETSTAFDPHSQSYLSPIAAWWGTHMAPGALLFPRQ